MIKIRPETGDSNVNFTETKRITREYNERTSWITEMKCTNS